MKTYNSDFKRIEGHAEPLELEQHYKKSAPAAGPDVASTGTHAGGGGIGWAAIGGLAAAFVVCAVYVLSGWGRKPHPAVTDGATVVAEAVGGYEAATKATATPTAQTAADTPDAVYLFPLNGSDIPENAELTELAGEAKSTGAEVNIVAYTDESGRADYNQRLSERRAKAVGAYLVAHGVEPAHVHTRGCGPTHAYATAELDRRAEITLM